ncbi:Lipoyl synthase [Dirofilaria immitis]
MLNILVFAAVVIAMKEAKDLNCGGRTLSIVVLVVNGKERGAMLLKNNSGFGASSFRFFIILGIYFMNPTQEYPCHQFTKIFQKSQKSTSKLHYMVHLQAAKQLFPQARSFNNLRFTLSLWKEVNQLKMH